MTCSDSVVVLGILVHDVGFVRIVLGLGSGLGLGFSVRFGFVAGRWGGGWYLRGRITRCKIIFVLSCGRGKNDNVNGV